MHQSDDAGGLQETLRWLQTYEPLPCSTGGCNLKLVLPTTLWTKKKKQTVPVSCVIKSTVFPVSLAWNYKHEW